MARLRSVSVVSKKKNATILKLAAKFRLVVLGYFGYTRKDNNEIALANKLKLEISKKIASAIAFTHLYWFSFSRIVPNEMILGVKRLFNIRKKITGEAQTVVSSVKAEVSKRIGYVIKFEENFQVLISDYASSDYFLLDYVGQYVYRKFTLASIQGLAEKLTKILNIGIPVETSNLVETGQALYQSYASEDYFKEDYVGSKLTF